MSAPTKPDTPATKRRATNDTPGFQVLRERFRPEVRIEAVDVTDADDAYVIIERTEDDDFQTITISAGYLREFIQRVTVVADSIDDLIAEIETAPEGGAS